MHRSTVVVLTVAVAVLGVLAAPAGADRTRTEPREPRVINGTEVSDDDAPWMAFLSVSTGQGTYRCGGSLIHPGWVITAGHCVTNLNDSDVVAPGEVTVTVGREDLTDGGDGEVLGVSQVLRHPSYDNSNLDHDVALVALASTSTAPVIRLANEAQTSLEDVGTIATVRGYGYTEGGNPSSASNQLMEADVEVRPQDECVANGLFTMCAGDLEPDSGDPPANDSCNGDSGGPLTVDDPTLGLRQVGLVSYGPADCGYEGGSLTSAGYSRVSYFEDFVHQHVGIMAFVADATVDEGDTDATVDVPVTLSRTPEAGDATSVRLSTADLTAVAPDDYTSRTDAVVAFTTDTATLAVEVVGDRTIEDDEVFSVVAGAASPIDVVRTGVVTVVDDDVAGILDATAGEADTLEVPIVLADPAAGGEEITISIGDATTPASDDLSTTEVTVVLTGGATSASASFPVVDDDLHERDETFPVRAQSTDLEIGVDTATARILDNDPLTATLSATTADEDDGTVQLVVDLSGPALAGDAIRVRSTTAGTASVGDDLEALDRVLDFDGGATTGTVTVTLLDDDLLEDDETATLELVDGDGVVAGTVGVLTIRDDDVPEVDRVAGDDRIATALATVADRADDSAQVAYLASSTSFPDALVATPLAHRDDAPLLLTPPAGLDGRVADEFARLLVDGGRVVLLGGQVALSGDVEAELLARGFATDRLAGENRFDTATLVADRLGEVQRVFLATGRDFPDALAAGAAAAAVDGAILLTDDRTMPTETIDWLGASTIPRTAIGGAAAEADRTADPLVGSDRHETAVLVARRFLSDATEFALASSATFPDALAGGVLIARRGGALLLTERDALPTVTANHLDVAAPRRVIVLGGEVAISESVRDVVAGLVLDRR